MRTLLPVLGATAVMVALGAGPASAAPATAPPVANTSQTLSVTVDGTGFTNSSTISFTSKKWSLSGYPDAGRFTNVGKKLRLQTTSKTDKGCTYKGVFVRVDTAYEGTFACPNGGPTGTFAVAPATTSDHRSAIRSSALF